MESPKSRDVVWWKADCGHEWQDSISNRTVKKKGCPNCERKFRTDLPRLLVTFYAKQYGMKAVFDSCRETGLSLDAYIPAASLAINFHRIRNGPRWRSEDIRSYACALKGISFFIIANWKTDRELAEQVRPSARGELEITSLNEMYLERGILDVRLLGRGFAWLDTGTTDSLLDAADFVRMVEKRQGISIAVPEEVAFINGWIDREKLLKAAEAYGKSNYGSHLKTVAQGRIKY